MFNFIRVFHILNDNAPEYLNDMFQFTLNSHYSLRSGKDKSLRQLKPNTEFYRICFIYDGCKLWNSVSVTIRDATSTSVVSFRKRLQLFRFHILLFLYNTYI